MDPLHPAAMNLSTIFQALQKTADDLEIGLVGRTVSEMCDRVRDSI